MPRSPARPSKPDVDHALTEALERLLEPLAVLCVAKGVRFPAAAELLKQAMVQAARCVIAEIDERLPLTAQDALVAIMVTVSVLVLTLTGDG